MLVWDLEEENRLLNVRTAQLETKLDEKQNRIDDLERWCAHLQGIIDANAEKEAQHRTQMERIKKGWGSFAPLRKASSAGCAGNIGSRGQGTGLRCVPGPRQATVQGKNMKYAPVNEFRFNEKI